MLYLFLLSILRFHAQANIFEICPPGFNFDGANCYLGTAPSGTRAFIFNNGFYHSPLPGKTCAAGFSYDGANCFQAKVPPNYKPFIFQNGWYTNINPLMTQINTGCPSGFRFDSRTCFFENAPSGREASIVQGHFAFSKKLFESCKKIDSRSYGLLNPLWCARMKVPENLKAFTHGNAWYVEPTNDKTWISRHSAISKFDPDKRACVPAQKSPNWKLVWGDEFSPPAPGQRCYNSTQEIPMCVSRDHWGFDFCTDAPLDWSSTLTWSLEQRRKYGGIVELNKCLWNVYDQFNQWESGNPTENTPTPRTSGLTPHLIQVRDGKLKMITSSYSAPSNGFNCGVELEKDPSNNGSLKSKNCPYQGAMISTEINLREDWRKNDPNNADPKRRYIGRSFGYGRYEFRANIFQVGHGAWPALWLYFSPGKPSSEDGIELDLLEGLAEYDVEKQLTGKETYFRAIQTVHNWGKPHTSDAITLPLKIGNWHTYAVEWDGIEIRFYIDDCLTHTVHHGKIVDNHDAPPGAKAPFNMPRNQNVHFIIGNPVSNKGWMPLWSRGQSPTNSEPRKDFIPTIIEVDWVRYYKN